VFFRIRIKTMKQKGFSLVEMLVVIVVIGIISAIAVPQLLAARRRANDASAVTTLRVVLNGEHTYKTSTGDGEYGTLAELRTAGIIDEVVEGGVKSGYVFSVVPLAAAGNDPPVFDAYGNAAIFGTIPTATGNKNYYTNESSVIYENAAGQDNPPDATSSSNRSVINGTPIDD
jgi:prepilin-type N-terminal cleavage/methylation domain-containing protein